MPERCWWIQGTSCNLVVNTGNNICHNNITSHIFIIFQRGTSWRLDRLLPTNCSSPIPQKHHQAQPIMEIMGSSWCLPAHGSWSHVSLSLSPTSKWKDGPDSISDFYWWLNSHLWDNECTFEVNSSLQWEGRKSPIPSQFKTTLLFICNTYI